MAAAATTLYTMVQVISALHILFCPYLPFSSQQLHGYLALEGDVSQQPWHLQTISPGTQLPSPQPLFPKLEELAKV